MADKIKCIADNVGLEIYPDKKADVYCWVGIERDPYKERNKPLDGGVVAEFKRLKEALVSAKGNELPADAYLAGEATWQRVNVPGATTDEAAGKIGYAPGEFSALKTTRLQDKIIDIARKANISVEPEEIGKDAGLRL